jgi:hypothetical protein
VEIFRATRAGIGLDRAFFARSKVAFLLRLPGHSAQQERTTPMPAAPPGPPARNRRDTASRDALLQRIVSEFYEMPSLRLTAAQIQRLFDLRADVRERVLARLVLDGTLTRDTDARYRLPDCRWPVRPVWSTPISRCASEAF